jgi:hypothetical protein
MLLLGICPKYCKSRYNSTTCILIFIASLFIIAKVWKQTRCPTVDEWVKKMLYITIECYAAMKKYKILWFASKWVELETIMLSKSHRWKIDPKDKLIYKYNKYDHIYIYIQNMFPIVSNSLRRPGGRERVNTNDRK